MNDLDARSQRSAANQRLFREVNERLESLAGRASVMSFVCECMDETCDQPVSMTHEEYERIRLVPDQFFVLPGHNVPEFETIVEATERFIVVAKLGAGGEAGAGD